MTLRGVVILFDDPRGLGEVEAAGVSYPFHCTAISDGSRRIEVGTLVTFELRAAGRGRWEATAVSPLG